MLATIEQLRAKEAYWADKSDKQVQDTIIMKELTDGFGILSDVQEELSLVMAAGPRFERLIELINHSKKHLIQGMGAIDDEAHTLRRDTMFASITNGFFCTCQSDD
jgi:hypothetical protein